MAELQSIVDRIKFYRDYKKYGKGEFEALCNLSNGYLNGTSTPGANKLEGILKACPDLNREWVMSGDGKMLNTMESNEQKKDEISTNKLNKQEAEKMKDKLIASYEDQIKTLKGIIEERNNTINSLTGKTSALKQRAG